MALSLCRFQISLNQPSHGPVCAYSSESIVTQPSQPPQSICGLRDALLSLHFQAWQQLMSTRVYMARQLHCTS